MIDLLPHCQYVSFVAIGAIIVNEILGMRIVLLGAPGSGKGTQARKLMADRNIPQISTGDMLRAAANSETEHGQQAKAIIDSGELISDEIMIGIISDRLAENDAADGYILDGFPRTKKQALDLEALLASMGTRLDAAVLMDVELNILMKRLTGRRTCSITGKLLNIYFSTQAELDECTSAGGELLQRKDDNEETIAHRLDVYRLQTEPLIDFYRSRDLLRTVAADGDVDVVYQRLLEAL